MSTPLKTKEELTPKFLIKYVYVYFVIMNKPLASKGGKCFYRGPKGSKCAIGCMILNKDYDITYENHNFPTNTHCDMFELFKIFGVPISELDGKVLSLLSKLQKLHDFYFSFAWTRTEAFEHWFTDCNIKGKYGVTLDEITL